MDDTFARLLVGIALVCFGMAGLSGGVEYSGWVLFVGLLAILCG